MVLLAFGLWYVLHFILSFFYGFIPPHDFPYHDLLLLYQAPPFIAQLASNDGVHYISIAKDGYFTYDQAFFPLYPLLMHLLNNLTQMNLVVTGAVISGVSTLLAFFVLQKYLALELPKKNIIWFFAFLFVFPTSFFFITIYTEGLFFLLLISTLYFTKKKWYILAFITGFLCALTRLIGIVLCIPLFFSLFGNFEFHKKKLVFHYRYLLYALVLLAPLLGFATYSYYLLQTTGDPFFFFHSQTAFGAHRSTQIILLPQVLFRYIKIIFHSDLNFPFFISLIELFSFLFTLTVLLYDLYQLLKNKSKKILERLGLNVFSLVNILLPTLTGTLSSIPRYALVSISVFFVLSEIKNAVVKSIILALLIILHIVLFSFFMRGYFVS